MVAIGIAINQENLKKSSLFQQIKKRINVILNFINSFDNKTISSPSKKIFELKRLNTCQE
jgi:hypothetical protein